MNLKNLSPLVALIIALVSLLVSAWGGYAYNDKVISERVTAVETQQKDDGQSINRVEQKIDTIDNKVDQLVLGLLGKKP